MISKKEIHTIAELQKIQYYASLCPDSVGLHSMDEKTIIDAKSYIGMYALDFSEPILIVSENEEFHKQIADIGTNLPLCDC